MDALLIAAENVAMHSHYLLHRKTINEIMWTAAGNKTAILKFKILLWFVFCFITSKQLLLRQEVKTSNVTKHNLSLHTRGYVSRARLKRVVMYYTGRHTKHGPYSGSLSFILMQTQLHNAAAQEWLETGLSNK